jgi:hypothetical protein
MSRTGPHHQPAGETTAAERRAEALRRAASSKRKAATTRAETAIRQLIKNQQEINFRSVARTAGVSLDFLYANTDLRRRIETLRAQHAEQTPTPATRQTPEDPAGNIVHVLTRQLREERAARRAAVHDLEQRLAAAHGELLRVRRLMQQHGIHT